MTSPGYTDQSVHILDDPTKTGPELLRVAVEDAGLWNLLATSCHAFTTTASDLPIVIKPELEAFDLGAPTATDPRLVEALIDLLHDHGYKRVAVASARQSSYLWAENRDVLAVADLLGYRFRTKKRRAYEFLDLEDGLTAGPFPPGSLLNGSQIATAWRDSFRICFTKNRTDESRSYALCLDTLLGVLPLPDKDYYYDHRMDAGEVVSELMRQVPPNLSIIDAIVSSHGGSGTRAPKPLLTHTLIASADVLLADLAGALKMGLDPSSSPIFVRARRDVGLPDRYVVHGNLARYPGWLNVHPLVVDSTRRRDRSPAIARTVRPWIQVSNTELFPFKTPLDAKANASVSTWIANVDDNPSPFWALVLTNYLLAAVNRLSTAYLVLYDKDKVRRRLVPLGVELADLKPSDCEAIASELTPLRKLLRSVPFDDNGLRWTYYDDAIIFEYKRTLPIPFDEFVSRVDVAKTIQFMNDYLGGVAVPLVRDGTGRATHQAERNIYLPQPNYLVLHGGDVIDVTKLEHITYGSRSQQMSWKTIRSENASATYDDGQVTFARRRGATQVSYFGRQQFALPLYWQLIDLKLAPKLRAGLITHAYTTFFSRTAANLEALVEGREIEIGRPWHDPAEVPGTEPLPIESLTRAAVGLAERYGPLLQEFGWLLGRQGERAPGGSSVDRNGFQHFESPQTQEHAAVGSPTAAAMAAAWPQIANFWQEMGDALGDDLKAAIAGPLGSF
jgi:uncharacterized protein (DUF362 family)